MQTFGELLGGEILSARERRGWTQLAVSEIAFGDHQGERRIRDYELGKVARPQPKVYLPICDALGISRRRISELKSISGDTRGINQVEIAKLRLFHSALCLVVLLAMWGMHMTHRRSCSYRTDGQAP